MSDQSPSNQEVMDAVIAQENYQDYLNGNCIVGDPPYDFNDPEFITFDWVLRRRLPCGWSRTIGDTVYFRGDGTSTTVILPEGKTVKLVRPMGHWGDIFPDGRIEFARAIPNGELITITLKDAE